MDVTPNASERLGTETLIPSVDPTMPDASPSSSETSPKPPRRLRRVAKVLAGFVSIVALGLLGLGVALHEPRPTGVEGPEAEALADALASSVDVAAWERTGAVRWRFGDRNDHLWDRDRGLSFVRFGDAEVYFRIHDQRGIAFENGVRVEDPAELVQRAYAHWANDSFWLNPLAKLRDPGTSRALVTHEGEEALLLSYSSGGVTPGDAYLWIPGGPSGRPRAWKMWVSIIPVGGIEVPWQGWEQLPTGAWVSTEHPMGLVTLRLTDVEAAATLAELSDEDPFAELLSTL